jgi:hypothetical protein
MAEEEKAQDLAEDKDKKSMLKGLATNRLLILIMGGSVVFLIISGFVTLVMMQMNQSHIMGQTHKTLIELRGDLDKTVAIVEEMRKASVDSQEALMVSSKQVDEMRGLVAGLNQEVIAKLESLKVTSQDNRQTQDLPGFERRIKQQSAQLVDLQARIKQLQSMMNMWSQAKLEAEQPANVLVKKTVGETQSVPPYLAYPVETPAMQGDRGIGYYP